MNIVLETQMNTFGRQKMNEVLDFSETEIQQMLDNLDKFTPEEVQEVDRIVSELDKRKYTKAVYDDLIDFCKHMQPDYIVGKHHRMVSHSLYLSSSQRGF